MNRGTVTGWTDDRVELLKSLWADGLSASQIAGELGGVTRNAVIGKAHRLKLPGRMRLPGRTRAPRPPRPRRAYLIRSAPRAALAMSEKEPLPDEPFDMPVGQRCGVLELNDEKCHWPVGDPRLADFFFCGGKPWTVGQPYCAHHTRLACERPVARRRRNKLPSPKQSAWSFR